MEPKEVAKWRNVNKLTRISLPLKKTVEQIFNISGLESVADNEPELAGIMRLPLNSYNPLIFFGALMEDIVEGNKNYDILFRPLMLHLSRSFLELSDEQEENYTEDFEARFKMRVERYMVKICFMGGHFDLCFEISKQHNSSLVWLEFLDSVKLGHNPIVECIIQRCTDMDVNLVGSALFCAVSNGHASIVGILLKNRPDISVFNVNISLHSAAVNGRTQIVEFILKHRPDIDVLIVRAALFGAVENGHASIVEILIQNRNDICAFNVDRALQSAVRNGHAPIVEILIQNLSDIPANNVGTCLRLAVENGQTTIVEILIQNRTDIPTNYLVQALDYATENGHTRIFDLIHNYNENIIADVADNFER
jgi:hypothetical protein